MSVADKLDAARLSLGGSNTRLAVCKATSREIMGPKKKHVDYLVDCTKNQQFDIANLVELLFERCRMTSWVIVSKALVTFHNLMSNGDQRFLAHMALKPSFLEMESFQDKTATAGYDMSAFIRRYSNYLAQKARSFGEVEYDFCCAKRGSDGALRSLDTETLLNTLRITQTHLDALLEVDLQSSEFSNGIINSAFVLCYKDMIKVFAFYNDGMIKTLEEYFKMNKENCKESLDIYKKFLSTSETVQKFLQVAQDVGVNENAIPDLTEAPRSQLEALQSHYESLQKGETPTSPKHTNLAPIKVPLASEQFNFNEHEGQTTMTENENAMEQHTLLQTAKATESAPVEDTWQTMFEPDQPKEKTTSTGGSSSDDLLQLNSLFQAQQVQQTPAAYFPVQSGFTIAQTASPNFTTNQTGFPPAVNAFGQPQQNVWGQNVNNTADGRIKSTNPFDSGNEAYPGNILQPMNKPQPQDEARTSTGDLHSTLNKVVNSLDDFDLSLNKPGTANQAGSGGHQWTAPKPKVKTGGADFQLGTAAGTTLSPTSPIPPTGPALQPMAPVSGAAVRPMVRPGYMQPAMYGGVPQNPYGQRPMMQPRAAFPQQNIRPTNPFGTPARNQALF